MIMSSSRRSSKQIDTSSEFYLECKAAFLSIYDDISDKIESKKRLNNVLQQSGRNPTRAALDRYWTKDTEELSFDDFVELCRKEPVTTADDLMKAFRKIDLNGDGYISLDELYRIMNAQGEQMTRDEVRQMIDEVDKNRDGKLDYSEFTNMIMKTTEESKKFSLKVMERKERKKRRAEKLHNSETEGRVSFKLDLPLDSARTVGEEIEYDDDFDIVSTGRPTPRVDLSTPKSGDKPKDDKPKQEANEPQEDRSKKEKSLKPDEKGNKIDRLVDNTARANSATRSGKNKDKAELDKKNDDKEDASKNFNKRNESESDKTDKKISKTEPSEKSEKDELADTARSTTSSFVDEIFKNSRRGRSVLSHEFELLSTNDEEDVKKTGRQEEKQESAPKPPPRKASKDVTKKEGLEDGESKSSMPARLNDVPRPSPRVGKGKLRSPSLRSRDAMPDPKTLKDWHHSTSKGCFFYEEDEIVTHVYSLKLYEDSTVYLCAYPIQEPACLSLPGSEPVDTALFVFDSRGKLVTCTEDRDIKGTYSVKCELSAGDYEILPYTTGCRFRQRPEEAQNNIKEAKLVKTKDDKVAITTAFRRALEDIFDLCDLDNNGTMSRDEFNWFNLRTSGEELGDDEWEVVEEKTVLENGEITKRGFIELNEMEAEDSAGDVEDLWITLTSMGMNKGLIMDEACPFRMDVYVESVRKSPRLRVTGIESLEKKEYVTEICQFTIEKSDEPVKIKAMKDLYKYTYRNEQRSTIVIDNKSRSSVSLKVDCSKSKNVVSNRPELDYTLDINPQDMAIAHHLLPRSELSDWTVSSTETILK